MLALHRVPKHRGTGNEETLIVRELWAFLKTRKKWWLGPILAAFILLALLMVFAQGSPLGPFIYTLF